MDSTAAVAWRLRLPCASHELENIINFPTQQVELCCPFCVACECVPSLPLSCKGWCHFLPQTPRDPRTEGCRSGFCLKRGRKKSAAFLVTLLALDSLFLSLSHSHSSHAHTHTHSLSPFE